MEELLYGSKSRNARESLRIDTTTSTRLLESNIESRLNEISRFRTLGLSAVHSPVLAQILIRKTRKHLDNIANNSGKKVEKVSNNILDRFRYRVRILQIICRTVSWFKTHHITTLSGINNGNIDGNFWDVGSSEDMLSFMAITSTAAAREEMFDLKLPKDLRSILCEGPRERTKMERIRVKELLRKHNLHTLFPREKEEKLWDLFVYERYEKGRVVFIQGRSSTRLYYLYSGRVVKVVNRYVAEGVFKRFVHILCLKDFSKIKLKM